MTCDDSCVKEFFFLSDLIFSIFPTRTFVSVILLAHNWKTGKSVIVNDRYYKQNTF